MTVSLNLNPRVSEWLLRRSQELGVSPEEFAADIIEGREAADEFRTLSRELSQKAANRGLTSEKLTELLDGETYE